MAIDEANWGSRLRHQISGEGESVPNSFCLPTSIAPLAPQIGNERGREYQGKTLEESGELQHFSCFTHSYFSHPTFSFASCPFPIQEGEPGTSAAKQEEAFGIPTQGPEDLGSTLSGSLPQNSLVGTQHLTAVYIAEHMTLLKIRRFKSHSFHGKSFLLKSAHASLGEGARMDMLQPPSGHTSRDLGVVEGD